MDNTQKPQVLKWVAEAEEPRKRQGPRALSQMSERDRGQAASCSTENKPSVLNLGRERLGLDTRKLR